jgi:hypothetical protein
MSGENLKSTPVTNLDATPVVVATSGEGLPGHMRCASDSINVTANVAQWSTYRLCRFPTSAKIKRAWYYISGIDSNATATATLDFNVAFSDSTVDGTPPALQGAIPSNKHDGTAFKFVSATGYSTSYASSGTGNKLFGNVAVSNSGAVKVGDLTYNNTTASEGFFPAQRDDDLWNYLGFVNGQGVAQDPGGFFDILVVVAAAVATAHAGVIAVEIDYVG